MLASELTYTVVDFEGTGVVKGYTDEPWQIGMVLFEKGHVVSERKYSSLLHVGKRPFNRYAPGRHAQLREQIEKAPHLKDLWSELRGWLQGSVLVAHNPATEKRYLKNAFPLHPMGPWIDTLKLARIVYPKIASHKLEDILLYMNLKAKVDNLLPDLEPHDALYDAMGSAVLLEAILALPGWESVTLDALFRSKATRYYKKT